MDLPALCFFRPFATSELLLYNPARLVPTINHSPEPMSTLWQLCDRFAEQADSGLHTMEQAFALTGKRVSHDPKSVVLLCQRENRNIYVKRYTQGGKFWRRYAGRSRVRAEWENLQQFAQWGIDVPPLLAYGEEYRGGRFERGALVTAEVPRAQSLQQVAAQQPSLLSDRHSFRELAAIIARNTRILHQHRFTHNDLDWRNILVVPADQANTVPRVLFFDCPGGRFWCWPFLEHRIIKDLAHLDKLGRRYLSPRQRLCFYQLYTGRQKLNAADKRRLKKIAGFFDETRYRKGIRF